MFSRLFGSKKTDDQKQAPPPHNPPAPPPRSPPAGPTGGNSGHGTGGGGGGGGGMSQTIETLDSTLETMDHRENLLNKKIEAEGEKAKQFMTKGNKNQALNCMKRKKMYEEQLNKINLQRANIETMKITMEEQRLNAQILAAQRQGIGEMERQNRNMRAEDVEEDLERAQEAMEDAKAVSDALANPIAMEVIDEDELMDELMGEMEKDKPQKEQTAPPKQQAAQPVAPSLDMPAVPSGNVGPSKTKSKAQQEEEELLKQLEAEMNA